MVKIEQLKDGAKATIVRDGRIVPVFLHQLISRQELETLQVIQGTVVYSVDELEILEKSAPTPTPTPAPTPAPEPAPAPAARPSAKEIAKAAKLQQASE